MMSESSQREKAQSSMQQEDKLEWCFLCVENVPKGYMDFMAKNISRTTR